ncbi:MAG: hypothetical protein HY966_00535 [Ignavibacteriales bacterium]|nr:hypothetical protein [Ignavibacteriales bacterium]
MAWLSVDPLSRFVRSAMIIGCWLAGIAPALAQISPGDLSRYHVSLEGMSNCVQCHEERMEISGNKCLSCHTEIQSVRNARRGLHFKSAGEACTSCHKEHLGRNARITQFDESSFDHHRADFALAGKHAEVKCVQCHALKNIKDPNIIALAAKRPSTHLGLDRSCLSCHSDWHHGTLPRCEQCHSAESWTTLTGFSHASTKFPLDGKHSSVVCERCHEELKQKAPGKPPARLRPGGIVFNGKSFADCVPCHTSPHTNRLAKTACALCHTADGWTIRTKFDHARTVFPLTGKHVQVVCEKCHAGFTARVAGVTVQFETKSFSDCSPCHRSPHAPTFSKQFCSTCHAASDWKKTLSNKFDHAMTLFPLRDRHTAVKCEQCHQVNKKRVMKPSADCIACHPDVHRGAFVERYGSACTRCHTERGFVPSTYTAASHNKSKFHLRGAHGATPCRVCHQRGKELVFRFADHTCSSCHADRHQRRFDKYMAGKNCDACHSVESWEVRSFDHGATGFALQGKHANAACNSCHQKTAQGETVLLTTKGSACASCHADAHAGQFAVNGATECARCHLPRSWNQLFFKHDVQSSFPLTGAHRTVDCRGCHHPEEQQGKRFIRYKPLSARCEACHQGGTKQ